ncbi:UNVERIFIED_CONTAM: hypothetical protein Sangu_2285100 [Sesamum angustifolium]|uniref:Reverse transcriptase domain-containing protein n=1 Tax=Sesamum angustifolium TaxID=2727405 RepID=A0AAW2L7K0_9LAMI
MSPGLFLLCMEYFSRLIKRKTTDSDFNFHPKCEKLKITHLLFADDLMMFSRGDLPSVHILMECLQEFRDVSGLAVNTSKSSIFTAGIENNMLCDILARTEFTRGEMPVRYLGIPLRRRGCRLGTTRRSLIKLPTVFPDGQQSSSPLRDDWNSYVPLFREWSVSGYKSSHSQRQSSRKSTDFVGIFSGTQTSTSCLGGYLSSQK